MDEGESGAIDVEDGGKEVGEEERGDDTEHGAEECGEAFFGPACDEVHDDGGEDGDADEACPASVPAVEAKGDEEFPDGEAAEDEAEEGLCAGPAAEGDEEEAEGGEEDG